MCAWILTFAAPRPAWAGAQALATLVVEVTADGRPVSGADVTVGVARGTTDDEGRLSLTVDAGPVEIIVSAPRRAVATATAVAGTTTRVVVALPAIPTTTTEITPPEIPTVEETVIVTATRTNTRLQDQPLRVEVIDREEIEEKALMTPGSVAMLLGETTGLRVQTTSPSLGGGNVRIQGLRGRYAQLLADGLPLYGGQADSFSLFQVPPLDLGQVEVIKGVASALYGVSALGGVINLVSRRPQHDEAELLLNTTSQVGRDVTGWVARAPSERGWSWSLLSGYHGQTVQDVDDDGWSDVPSFERGMARPRVFFDNRRGRTLLATVGVTLED